MTGLQAEDVFISDRAKVSLRDRYRDVLLRDCLHGEPVGRNRIPKVLRGAHAVENLYVEDLPAFWRLLYSVVEQEDRRFVVILEIVDHRTYSRWFRRRH